MAGVDLGRVAYVPKGAYSAEVIYSWLDVVTYLGSGWVSLINNNIGNTPTEGVNWSLVAQKGEKGDKMAFADLTQEEKDELKGVKGDPFVYSDFTSDQLKALEGESAYQIWLAQPGNKGKTVEEFIASLKGDKGDPFTYDMFTPEQLEGLKGQNGVISVDAPEDGKTYGRKNLSWVEVKAGEGIVVPSTFTTLLFQNKADLSVVTSEEILTSLGGESGFNTIYNGVLNHNPGFIAYNLDGIDVFCPLLLMVATEQEGSKIMYLYAEFNTPGQVGIDYSSAFIMIEYAGGIYRIAAVISTAPYVAWLDLNELSQYAGKTMPDDIYKKVEDAFVNKIHIGKFEYYSTALLPLAISNNMSDYTITANVSGFDSPTTTNNTLSAIRIVVNKTTKATRADLSDLVFNKDGDGTKALMNNGSYKKIFNPEYVTTATTLTGLSIANYSIIVTLSAASALSFAGTPAEGWECMIDIKNTGSSTITQALPNASGWQCEDTSVTIEAGKIASISVRYVHGVYLVIAKGQ